MKVDTTLRGFVNSQDQIYVLRTGKGSQKRSRGRMARTFTKTQLIDYMWELQQPVPAPVDAYVEHGHPLDVPLFSRATMIERLGRTIQDSDFSQWSDHRLHYYTLWHMAAHITRSVMAELIYARLNSLGLLLADK